jgi:hypothetical protein
MDSMVGMGLIIDRRRSTVEVGVGSGLSMVDSPTVDLDPDADSD